ncbi:hypothetical protein ES703_92235 [subsurface metagenome]
MLVLAHWTQAGVSMVRNGSFENDGQIPDITVDAPQYWCGVNIPSDKFGGKVSTTWKTKGNYSLFFYVKNVDTYAGDMAMIFQWDWLTDVLGDVNEIYFDIKLSDPFGNEWDLEKRTALVLIDDTVVWDSNDLGPSVNGDGEYLDRWIDVGIYDASPHKLTLAIKINEDISKPGLPYWAQWDFVRFDTHCEGYGYLWGDFNYDCYVDISDFKMLAYKWLKDVDDPNKYDLFYDGIVNFNDFTIFANNWMSGSYGQEDKLLLADLNHDGIVDFCDFAILSKDWGSDDNCIAADVDNSGEVDYTDVFILADEWLRRNWLYGLN